MPSLPRRAGLCKLLPWPDIRVGEAANKGEAAINLVPPGTNAQVTSQASNLDFSVSWLKAKKFCAGRRKGTKEGMDYTGNFMICYIFFDLFYFNL